MQALSRRTFLKYTAALSLGAALPAWSDAVIAPANPADLQVDAEKLAGVVAFIEAEIAAGTIPGAGLVATRRGRKFVEHFSGT